MNRIPRLIGAAALTVALTFATGCAAGSSGRASGTPSATVTASRPLPTAPDPTATPSFPDPRTDEGQRTFLRAVFDDQNRFWAQAFTQAGIAYPEPKLTLFEGTTETGCGTGESGTGPFYCPADHGVYVDGRFFRALEQRFGVEGGFPQAYVMAHEVAHHVQNALGTLGRMRTAQQRHPGQENDLSVRLELQADCYAGVWAHTTWSRDLLTEADLRQALHAAAVVGDDFQQHVSGGDIRPEDWTHGSAAQRQQWLSTGFTTGSVARCDTFRGTPVVG